MYEKFYRFTGHPFRLSPDPAFFFGSKGHRRALAYLRYGLTQKEGFIVVTGAPGTGKTTLARALLQETAREKVVIAELNNTHLQADDVLRMTAASFGLEHENLAKASLLKRLEGFFLSKYRAGYHCLLLIDEAQNLPIESLEELRMLSNFYQGKHALLQIFLMGQQQFRDLLYSPNLEQLRQRVVAATHLEALDAAETRDYVVHRLKHVGWTGQNPAFSKRAFAHIFALTKGIPRRINTFCDRLLLYASLEELNEIRDATVRAVARELVYEISQRSTAATQSQAEVLNDVKDVDSALNSVPDTESDFDLVSPDDVVHHNVEEAVSEPSSTVTPVVESEKPSTPPPESRIETPSAPAKVAVDRPNNLRVVSNDKTALAPRIVEDADAQPAANDDWVDALSRVYAYYREPKRSPEWLSSSTPLPPGMMGVIQSALGKWAPSAEQLGSRFSHATQDDVKNAARQFIQNVCLSTTADYYRRLGLSRQANDDDIKHHYRAMFRLFQPDQASTGETWDKSFSQKIGQAYSVLRDAIKRRAYDQFLDSLTQPSANTALNAEGRFAPTDDVFIEQDVFTASEFELPENGDTRTQPAIKSASAASSATRYIIAGTAVIVVALVVAAVLFVQTPSEQTNTDVVAEDSSSPGTVDSSAVTTGETTKLEMENVVPLPNSEVAPSDPASFGDSMENVAVDAGKKKKRVVDETDTTSNITQTQALTTTSENTTQGEKQKSASETVKPIDETPPASGNRSKSGDGVIQQSELKALINRFALSYEEADVDALMSLFSEKATTNDSQNKAEIRKDYLSLFKSSDMRVIDITNLRWKIEKNLANGNGDFKVTVLRKGGKDMRSFVGSIQFSVEKSDGRLLINEIFHAYSMDERQ